MQNGSTWVTITDVRRHLHAMMLEYWKHDNLFTWQWWLAVALTGISFVLWVVLLDKRRLIEVMLYATCIEITATFFDLIGGSFMLWSYPIKVLPIVLPLQEVDLVILPEIYSLLYQKFSSWKSFALSVVLTSGAFSFIGEPLLIKIGAYQVYHWSYTYSFLIYIAMGLFWKWLLSRLIKKQRRAEVTG